MCDISGFGFKTDTEFAQWLIEKGGVATGARSSSTTTRARRTASPFAFCKKLEHAAGGHAGEARRCRRRREEEEDVKRELFAAATEQRHPARRIDALSVRGHHRLINREDASIAEAVGAESQIARVREPARRSGEEGRPSLFVARNEREAGGPRGRELPPTFDTPATLAQAIMAGGPECVWASKEGAEMTRATEPASSASAPVHALDAVIGITASGVTPFVLGALGEARRKGAATGPRELQPPRRAAGCRGCPHRADRGGGGHHRFDAPRAGTATRWSSISSR
jgi:hypothetical protein